MVTLAEARNTVLKTCPLLALSAAFAAPPPPSTVPDVLQTVRSGNYAHTLPGFHARAAVLNWNIDRGQRLDDIKEQIRQRAPDLCIFQEVDLGTRRTHKGDIAKELAETFSMNYVFGPEFQELGQGTADEPAYQGQALQRLALISGLIGGALAELLKFRAENVIHTERFGEFFRDVPFVSAPCAEVDFLEDA